VKPPSASEGNAVQIETSRFEVTGAKDGEEPFEVESITDSTEAALAMRLGTSTRDDIDARTPVLIGHLQRLLLRNWAPTRTRSSGTSSRRRTRSLT
jgi:hypothetical protein